MTALRNILLKPGEIAQKTMEALVESNWRKQYLSGTPWKHETDVKLAAKTDNKQAKLLLQILEDNKQKWGADAQLIANEAILKDKDPKKFYEMLGQMIRKIGVNDKADLAKALQAAGMENANVMMAMQAAYEKGLLEQHKAGIRKSTGDAAVANIDEAAKDSMHEAWGKVGQAAGKLKAEIRAILAVPLKALLETWQESLQAQDRQL